MMPDEAVERLRSAGLYARRRAWALGQTILVCNGEENHDGMKTFREGLYLVRTGPFWVVLREPNNQSESMTLEKAVELAILELKGTTA